MDLSHQEPISLGTVATRENKKLDVTGRSHPMEVKDKRVNNKHAPCHVT